MCVSLRVGITKIVRLTHESFSLSAARKRTTIPKTHDLGSREGGVAGVQVRAGGCVGCDVFS